MKARITPAGFRLVIQFVFALFCVHVGFRFAAFLAWAMGETLVFTAKPGAVEGFLPISALLALRHLLAVGEWDMVHPAGLTILLAILVMAFLFRKGFCGYLCPVGFLSNLLERAGRRMHLARIPHKWIDYPLMSIKYGLAGFFLYTVFFAMDLRAVQAFLSAPYNMVAEGKMLIFFTDPSSVSLAVIVGLVVFSLVVRNAWCRYLCPYGALLGLLSRGGPTAIARDEETCIGCGKCTAGCPAGIAVERQRTVRSSECIGCAECIGNCPVDGCLAFSMVGRVRIPWFGVGLGAVSVLLLFWAVAITTGHWETGVSPAMLKRIYQMVLGGG